MTANSSRKIIQLAATSACLALLAPAAGHAQFGPPFTVSGERAQSGAVGSSSSGDALVVWAKFPESTGPVRLQARARSAGGVLGPIETVSGSSNVVSARAETAANGDAIIAWQNDEGRIRARRRDAGGTLGPIRSLSAADSLASSPAVAIDADGDSIIVWQADFNGVLRIQARALSSDGEVAATQFLSAANDDASIAEVAMEEDGDAVAVWTRNGRVEARARSKTGVLSPVFKVSPVSETAFDPLVAIDSDGDAVILWRRLQTGQIYDFKVRTLSASGDLSDIQTVAAGVSQSAAYTLNVRGNGQALITWRQTFGLDDVRIIGRVRAPGGGLGVALDLTGSTNAQQHVVAMTSSGFGLIAWVDSTGAGVSVVRARTRSAQGDLGPVDAVSPSGGQVAFASVALDAAGNAIAVWTAANGGETRIKGATGP